MVSANAEKLATSEKNTVMVRVSPPSEGSLLDLSILSMTAGARYQAKLLRRNILSLSVTARRNPIVPNSARTPANNASSNGSTSVFCTATMAAPVQAPPSSTKEETATAGDSNNAPAAAIAATAAAM